MFIVFPSSKNIDTRYELSVQSGRNSIETDESQNEREIVNTCLKDARLRYRQYSIGLKQKSSNYSSVKLERTFRIIPCLGLWTAQDRGLQPRASIKPFFVIVFQSRTMLKYGQFPHTTNRKL